LKRIGGAALLLGGALFLGCAAIPGGDARRGDAPARGRSAAPLTPEALPAEGRMFIIPGVPFLPQEKDACGPTALAMLLRFYGREAPVAEIVRETRTEGLRGVLITDLAAAARRRGFDASVEDLDLDGLRRHILAGTPVVLLVDLGMWVISRPHYMLAYGMTPEGTVVHSGRTEGQIVSFSALETRWSRMGRLALVVRPSLPGEER
jgi:ABC-type bacteriocin/lantibiotic exporter with double-glycine peptidase domain